MVATACRIRQDNFSSSELTLIRAERDELRARILVLEGEKHVFYFHYNILAGEKASLEEQVAKPD